MQNGFVFSYEDSKIAEIISKLLFGAKEKERKDGTVFSELWIIQIVKIREILSLSLIVKKTKASQSFDYEAFLLSH